MERFSSAAASPPRETASERVPPEWTSPPLMRSPTTTRMERRGTAAETRSRLHRAADVDERHPGEATRSSMVCPARNDSLEDARQRGDLPLPWLGHGTLLNPLGRTIHSRALVTPGRGRSTAPAARARSAFTRADGVTRGPVSLTGGRSQDGKIGLVFLITLIYCDARQRLPRGILKAPRLRHWVAVETRSRGAPA